MTRTALMCLVLSLISQEGLHAQVSVRIGPSLYLAEHLVKGRGAQVFDSSERGAWLGVAATVRLSLISLTATSLFGELSNDEFDTVRDEGIRVSRVSLQLHPTTWLSFGPDADVWRSVRRTDGLPRERIIQRFGWGVTLSGTLGVTGLRVVLDGAVYPLGAASEYLQNLDYNEGWEDAINSRLSVALEYAPTRAPVYLRIGYAEQRYLVTGFTPFTGFSDSQNDHFRGLTASAGLRLGAH